MPFRNQLRRNYPARSSVAIPATSIGLPRVLILVLCAAAVVSCAGCSPQEEIQEYVVESDSGRIVTSEVLRDEFGAIPFQWDVPKAWTPAANDRFSKVAWTVGQDGDTARITVSHVPIASGLVPQLVRWRGQLEIESDPSDDPMRDTEKLDLAGTAATYVNFKGSERAILGLFVPQASKLWVFKLSAANAAAEKQESAFRAFCESINIPSKQEG